MKKYTIPLLNNAKDGTGNSFRGKTYTLIDSSKFAMKALSKGTDTIKLSKDLHKDIVHGVQYTCSLHCGRKHKILIFTT